MGMNPRLLRPTASGFDPRRISGLVGWYDASDRATLFDATTGGSAVAADGAVGRWQDKSGNGNHLTQGTDNNRPTLKTAIKNGRAILRFDGSNDSMAFTTGQQFNGAFSLFAVFYETATRFVAVGSNNEYTPGGLVGISFFGSSYSGNNILWRNNSDAGFTVSDTNPNRFILLSGIRTGTGTNQANLRRDAGTINSTGTLASGFNAGGVGSRMAGGTQQFSTGDYAELVMFSRAVSTLERDAIENYLNRKWAIY